MDGNSNSSNLSTLPPSDIYFVTPFESADGLLKWTWMRTVLSLILGTITLVTIFGNALVLFIFGNLVKKGLRAPSPTHYLIANLSLADFLVGIAVLPFLGVYQVTERWYFGQIFCITWICSHYWLCAASILSTAAICIERYIGVCYPLKYTEILTPFKILLISFGVWTLAGIPSVIRVFAWTYPPVEEPFVCKINQKIGHAILACVGILYIPSIVMIVLYSRIFCLASKHLKSKNGQYLQDPMSKTDTLKASSTSNFNIQPEKSSRNTLSDVPLPTDDHSSNDTLPRDLDPAKPPSLSTIRSMKERLSTFFFTLPGHKNQNSHSNQQSRQINLAKKLFILVGIVLLSYVPYFTMILIRAVNPVLIPDQVFHIFAWIRYFNSCINPFIYAYAVPVYRKAFRRCFTFN